MLSLLKDRIENYDLTSRLIMQGDYYIEYLDDGILMTYPKSTIFFRNDGRIGRLSKKCSTLDWDLHCELYESIKHTTCRIEIPVQRESIIVSNELYHYSEVQRPNNDLGQGFLDDIADSKVDTQYFIDYVEQVTAMLGYLIKVTSKHQAGLPEELLAPYKRYTDSTGSFWVDFKNWNTPLDKFIEKKIRTLYLTLLTLEDDEIDYKKIMLFAEKQWNLQ